MSLVYLLLISAAAAFSAVAATDHIVGANRGWNPGINYTLWANNQTFYVNDLISFRYQKNQYNVFEVNQTGYDNCTTDGATGNWSSGKDFILLDKAKRYYFICGNGGCFSGMKVSVLVHPLPPPPSASATGDDVSKPKSAAARAGRLGFMEVVGTMAWVGWIWLDLVVRVCLVCRSTLKSSLSSFYFSFVHIIDCHLFKLINAVMNSLGNYVSNYAILFSTCTLNS